MSCLQCGTPAIRDTAKLCNPRHEPTTASRPDPDLPIAWRPSFERLRDAQAALRWFRRTEEAAKKAEAKAKGEVISTKRKPEGPKPGFMVEGATLETVTPIPYDVVNDLKGGY
jgi:hypothetical protein